MQETGSIYLSDLKKQETVFKLTHYIQPSKTIDAQLSFHSANPFLWLLFKTTLNCKWIQEKNSSAKKWSLEHDISNPMCE